MLLDVEDGSRTAKACNVCFGGRELRTAYATLSMGGTLVAFKWPHPGLPLHYLNR